MSVYDDNFYNIIDSGALNSARILVPEIIKLFNPKSVIDIGCGTGAWLVAFMENGINDVLGVDGEYNNFATKILGDKFISADLSNSLVLPKKYDLLITLEVAEHINEASADIFIDNITNLSDNIIWSAAVPGQRGLNHVNEQFPSYWIPKFLDRGYSCNGDFRLDFWYDERIENWYRQNILLFSKNIKWNNPVKDLIHYNNYPNYENIEQRYMYDN